jgi:hypothetical protein
LKPVVASALMAAVMIFMGHSWILQMMVGLLVYLGAILLIAPSERAQVLTIATAIFKPSMSQNLQGSDLSPQSFQSPED